VPTVFGVDWGADLGVVVEVEVDVARLLFVRGMVEDAFRIGGFLPVAHAATRSAH
jgi:hypothetical protein